MMTDFLVELRPRHVYRVTAAYVAGAAAIIRLGEVVVPALGLPGWFFRGVIVLLLIGFPAALLCGWLFDITPQGLRSTDEAAPPKASASSRRNLVVLLVIGLAISAVAGFLLLPRMAARKLAKSVAVLPFANLSDKAENAFFADGIQDDLLTRLAKIGDLKVISRTSVMEYRGNPRNVREIANALGVGTILEGSVRRSGNRVRATVQLIDGRNDEHIWAEDYDRELTDVFAVQSELASEIASQLRAKLAPGEQARVERCAARRLRCA